MPYIEPELVAEAKKMDLLTYLKNYEIEQLVDLKGGVYCTREHDSLKISNGKWCWWSRGILGKPALDYLIKVQNIPFVEAVEIILGQEKVRPSVFVSKEKTARKREIIIPKMAASPKLAIRYLVKERWLDQEIVMARVEKKS